jgi:hypothetical protein
MREWRDYSVSAPISIYGAKRAGIAARVQGLRRYYSLVLARGDRIQLIRELDGTTVLGESGLTIDESKAYSLELRVEGDRIIASIEGLVVFDLIDPVSSLGTGAVGYVVEEGTLLSDCMALAPLQSVGSLASELNPSNGKEAKELVR